MTRTTAFTRILVFIFTAFIALFPLQGAHATVKLTFGVYTSDKATTLVKKFRPAINALEQSMSTTLGQPVSIKMHIAKSYEEGISAIVRGSVDFSRLGPASYIEAKRANPDLVLLAMEATDGQKWFNGVICVADQSAIHSITDLKGKTFAFGNQRSTIGRYLAQYHLASHGIKARDLQSFDYLERHDQVGYAVATGRFDAGALKESTFRALVAKGQPLRAVASFKNVTKPWLARSGLPEPIRQALQQALLDLKDPAVLRTLKKDGFLPANDADFEIVRYAIQENAGFFK